MMSFDSSRRPARRGAGKTPAGARNLLTFERLEPRETPAAAPVDFNTFTGALGDGSAEFIQATPDGRFAIFSSTATNLVNGQVDVAGTRDLFWTDLLTGDIDLVTRTSNLAPNTSLSNGFLGVDPFGQATISADGLFVAFTSKANAATLVGLPDAQAATFDRGNATSDVFRWSVLSGNFSLVSRTAGSTFAFGQASDATDPAISNDGNRVSFVSIRNAADAVAAVTDDDLTRDLFVTEFDPADDSNTGKFTQEVLSTVSVAAFRGATAAATVTVGFLSRFDQPADAAAAGATPNRAAGVGVTVDPLGRYLSADGRTAVFIADMNPAFLPNGLVEPTPRTVSKRAEVYHVGSQGVRLVTASVSANSANANGKRSIGFFNGGAAENAILAPEAPNSVLFTANVVTPLGVLVPGFTTSAPSRAELYYREMTVGTEFGATPVLVTAAGKGPTVAANGGLEATDGKNPAFPGRAVDPRGYNINRDGRFVTYATAATDVIQGQTDTNGPLLDVYRRALTDATAAGTVLVSASINPISGKVQTPAAGNSRRPSISADGLLVAFESTANAADIVLTSSRSGGAVDTNGDYDVFVRDLRTSTTTVTTTLASSLPNAVVTGNGPSTGAFVTAAGRTGRVFFNSTATNISVPRPGGLGNQHAYSSDVGQPGAATKSLASNIAAVSGGSPAAVSFLTFDVNGASVVGDKFTPFPGFTGELRVATADVDRDGTADIVVGAGPGGGSRVAVVSGAGGKVIRSFLAFEPSFNGGVFVAAADFNRDGFADIAVGADNTGGSRIRVFSGKDGVTVLSDFFAYEGSFRGGVRVAAGDVTGDGTPDLVTGAGFGGGPRVSVFSGANLASPVRVVDFFAYEASLRNGVFVGAGDVNNDGRAEVVTGGGPGGGPRVTVFDAQSLFATPQFPTQLLNFFAFDSSSRSGVRVAIKDVDGDLVGDVVAGEGSGRTGRVRAFSGGKFDAVGQPSLISDFVVYDDFNSRNGAWVG